MSPEKPRRLGRGLEALMTTPQQGAPDSDLQRVALSRIRPNPYQPRREFHAEELADLQASLKASGLLQPITLRRSGDAFELIAGERRLRAATNLGWKEIPAIVRDLDDQTMLVLALVENLQRADLSPVDEARGYQRLITDFGHTQQQVADAVGKDRSTVANLLRILALPESVLRMLEQGLITAGHARAILSLGNERQMLDLANEIVAGGLSVRQTEQRSRAPGQPGKPGKPTSERGTRPGGPEGPAPSSDPAVRGIEDQLRRHFQTDVQISQNGPEKGTVKLSFYSSEDFERLLDLMLGAGRDMQ